MFWKISGQISDILCFLWTLDFFIELKLYFGWKNLAPRDNYAIWEPVRWVYIYENCLNKVDRILTEPNVLLFPRPKKRPISPFKRGQITSKSNSSDNSIGPWRHVSSSHKPFCFNVYNQKQHLFWKEKGGRKKVVNLFRIFLDPCLNKKKVVDGVDKVL